MQHCFLSFWPMTYGPAFHPATCDCDWSRFLCRTHMEKKYVTGCLSDCFYSLPHIWALNYSCWKWTEIYSELDRILAWACSPVPAPHTAMEPWTHMGAIIGKVAVVAPGNHFEKCVRVSVCIVEHACVHLLAIIVPSRLKWAAVRKCAVARRRCREIIVPVKSQTLPPTHCSLKKDYLFEALV